MKRILLILPVQKTGNRPEDVFIPNLLNAERFFRFNARRLIASGTRHMGLQNDMPFSHGMKKIAAALTAVKTNTGDSGRRSQMDGTRIIAEIKTEMPQNANQNPERKMIRRQQTSGSKFPDEGFGH